MTGQVTDGREKVLNKFNQQSTSHAYAKVKKEPGIVVSKAQKYTTKLLQVAKYTFNTM